MEINVLIDEGLGECLEESWLERVAEKVLTAQGVDSSTEFGLVIVSQERIRQLNLSYLGKDVPTDVLAFSLLPEQTKGDLISFVSPPDGIKHLGEVIISYPQAVIQAKERQHSVKREIAILIIHGVLHLLGYEHDTPEQEREMRARETEILNYIEGELK
ncbi:rRNA maturation RNase YbeY [Chloroflexota bacterium]